MADILLNKQVNVWRGDQEPPTIYHVWISGSQTLKLYNGKEWQTFLDNPGLTVTSNTDGSVKVSNGDTYFTIGVSGQSLSIQRSGSNIVIKSNALNTIPTDEWLNWSGDQLSHNVVDETKAVETYGPRTNISSSTFTVPSLSVDAKGHVVKGESLSVTIPDKVVQNPITDDDTYPVILAGSSSTSREVGEVNKDGSLALSIETKGGITTKVLKTPGIEAVGGVTITGNLVVPDGYTITGTIVGNVSGTATPTNHADETTKYGIGTAAGENGVTAMYGHVKLQDELPTTKPPSGGTQAGAGIAASPLMVWNALEKVDNKFSTDFIKHSDDKFYINWEEI